MKKLILVGVLLAAVYFGGVESGFIPQGNDSGVTRVDDSDRRSTRAADSPIATADNSGAGDGEQALAAAFENRQRNVQVQAGGRVKKLLSDDDEGSRHQRFIVELASGQTVLVAHNIDLAKRVESLRSGDRVEFYGEYEWNAQGGVIHWTHHDPRGSHVAGWIRHNGRTYQ